jgi:hypothetical protein
VLGIRDRAAFGFFSNLLKRNTFLRTGVLVGNPPVAFPALSVDVDASHGLLVAAKAVFLNHRRPVFGQADILRDPA